VVAPGFEVAVLVADLVVVLGLALPPGLLNLSVTPVRDLAVRHSRSLTKLTPRSLSFQLVPRLMSVGLSRLLFPSKAPKLR